MSRCTTGCDALPFAEYRREARRLRKVYAGRPVPLYRQLAQLAVRQDISRLQTRRSNARSRFVDARVVPSNQSILPLGSIQAAFQFDAAEKFANLAALQFDGPVLRYSRRLALLRLADQMSIPRFHASLLIALAQHQRSTMQTATDPSASRPWIATAGLQIGCILLVQIGIVLAGWVLLR